ncbi:hypothetical protein KL929_000091 [Ogataea haglerorum]|nr:hypothetical protein KL929_000091 [Ogataea haglerorum]
MAIDISDEHFAAYPKMKELIGSHLVSKTEETPPSTKKITWYLKIIDSGSGSFKDDTFPSECPKDSQLCGLTEISLPNRDPVITEVFSFSNKLTPQFDVNTSSFTVNLLGANWGAYTLDARIEFVCASEDNAEGLKLAMFDYSTVSLHYETACACKSDERPPKDRKNKSPKNDDSNSWGVFTWLFILLVIVMASYIIAQAWINTNRVGSSHEFLNELVESIVETVTKLPEFLREIANKLFSSGSRGGYSAV